jgi:hypothetical protein
MEAVRKVLDKLEMTESQDENSVEATREAFREILRTLDKATPWPQQDKARFERIRRITRKALALFGQGRVAEALKTLKEVVEH